MRPCTRKINSLEQTISANDEGIGPTRSITNQKSRHTADSQGITSTRKQNKEGASIHFLGSSVRARSQHTTHGLAYQHSHPAHQQSPQSALSRSQAANNQRSKATLNQFHAKQSKVQHAKLTNKSQAIRALTALQIAPSHSTHPDKAVADMLATNFDTESSENGSNLSDMEDSQGLFIYRPVILHIFCNVSDSKLHIPDFESNYHIRFVDS